MNIWSEKRITKFRKLTNLQTQNPKNQNKA